MPVPILTAVSFSALPSKCCSYFKYSLTYIQIQYRLNTNGLRKEKTNQETNEPTHQKKPKQKKPKTTKKTTKQK